MKIEREKLLEKLEQMKKDGYTYLVKITAVDYVKNFEVLYFVRDIEKNDDQVISVDLNPDDVWVPSVMEIFKAADWYERELYEMFGVSIKGRRIKKLLLEKWDGTSFPLRKSFAWNSEYETEK